MMNRLTPLSVLKASLCFLINAFMTDQQQALSQKKEPIVVGIVMVARPGRPVQNLKMDASFSSALFMRICASRYLIG